MSTEPKNYSRKRHAAAWGVHLYTALGLPLALLGVAALSKGDAFTFFLALSAAAFIDGTDGTLARWVKVKEVVPQFDGRRLDDLVDFLTYVFLPVLALAAFDMFPDGQEWMITIPLLASGYGFCQDAAKTEDAFVGFPSYWNVVVFYLYMLGVSPIWNMAILLILSLLVFLPIHYIYPSRTRMWMRTTVILGCVWGILMVTVLFHMEAKWAPLLTGISLFYPLYYVLGSSIHHHRIHQDLEESPV